MCFMGLFGKQKVRFTATSVEMMAACGDINGLVRALADGDGETVNKVTESLERIGNSAADPLLQLCNSRDPDLQLKAADILGNIKCKKAVPTLIKLAYSPDVDVRAGACLSLGPIDDDRAISPLIYRLSDGSHDVRDAAAFSLSGMGDRIIPPVVASLARANQQLLSASENIKTAKELGNFDPSIIARSALSKSQLELLQDGIVMIISYADKPWITEFLRCMFFRDDVRDADLAVVIKCGSKIFDPLADLIRCESDDIRQRAIVSLGVLNDENAIKPLEQQLNDDSSAIREAAAMALRNITETGLLDINRDKGPEKNRVSVTFPCEYCGVPIDFDSKYCPACGALFFDTGGLVQK
jgi:HEAT repeat protein